MKTDEGRPDVAAQLNPSPETCACGALRDEWDEEEAAASYECGAMWFADRPHRFWERSPECFETETKHIREECAKLTAGLNQQVAEARAHIATLERRARVAERAIELLYDLDVDVDGVMPLAVFFYALAEAEEEGASDAEID